MNNLWFALLRIAVPVILIIIAFQFNTWAGWGLLVVYVLVTVYMSRSRWYAARGNMEYTKGNKELALQYFRKAAADPNASSQMICSLGYLLLTQGHWEEAEETIKKARKKAKDRQDVLNAELNLSLVLWKKGEHQEAIELLQKLDNEYKNTVVYGNLGYFLVLDGRLEEALAYNLEAYDFNSGSKSILDNLAQTYYLMEEYNKAKEIYGKLMTMDSTIAETYYYYGLTLLALNEKEKAVEILKKAMEYEVSLISPITKEDIREKLEQVSAS
ncbi:tetratricopeptide repeat protein [Marinicrinis lubricantis]|uniref:Tetratricopeptide repeat protein n=1 Tax=Marinicrinis lubricantis TaxID=2086470 RepID=A0ABW1INM6_9BACL